MKLIERIVDTFWFNLGRIPEKEDYIEFHVEKGNCRVVADLFRKNPALSGFRDMFGNPLLIWAVDEGQKEMVELLLSHGCDINGTDAEGATALHWAVCDKNLELALCLIAHGASPNIADENGDVPLDWAEPEFRAELERIIARHRAQGGGARDGRKSTDV